MMRLVLFAAVLGMISSTTQTEAVEDAKICTFAFQAELTNCKTLLGAGSGSCLYIAGLSEELCRMPIPRVDWVILRMMNLRDPETGILEPYVVVQLKPSQSVDYHTFPVKVRYLVNGELAQRFVRAVARDIRLSVLPPRSGSPL